MSVTRAIYNKFKVKCNTEMKQNIKCLFTDDRGFCCSRTKDMLVSVTVNVLEPLDSSGSLKRTFEYKVNGSHENHTAQNVIK